MMRLLSLLLFNSMAYSCKYTILMFVCFFFFNDTATTEIYSLPLHDAFPFWCRKISSRYADAVGLDAAGRGGEVASPAVELPREDRKSTRLNSSHANISYAVFCLKKKKKQKYSKLTT